MSESEDTPGANEYAEAWNLIETWASAVDQGNVDPLRLDALIRTAVDQYGAVRLVGALTAHGAALIQRTTMREGGDVPTLLAEIRGTVILAQLEAEVDSDDES